MNIFKPQGTASPLTTKGDLWVYGANNDQRLPVAADGLFLKSDSSVTLGVSWSSPTGVAVSVTTITASVTLGSSIDVAYVSGGTFTITLPNAASFTIKPIHLVRIDNAMTLPIYINGLLGGSTNWAFYTQNESYRIIPDGTNWQLLEHYAQTPWSQVNGVTILATTTNPDKGASILVDNLWWRRNGSVLEARYSYKQATAGNAQTGDYIITPPAGLFIDTTRVQSNTTVEGTGLWEQAYSVGTGAISINTSLNVDTCVAVVFGATGVRLFGGGGPGVWSSAYYAFSNAALSVGAEFRVPIVGWKD